MVKQFLGNIKGEKGEQGIQGEKGEQGEQGIQGEKGERGLDYTESNALFMSSRLNSTVTVPDRTYVTLKDMDVDSNGVQYNPLTGEWLPNKGLWLIEARVHYSVATSGAMYLRIIKDGIVQASEVQPNNVTYQTGISTQTILKFNGSEKFIVSTQNSSGGDMVLNNLHFTRVQAIYLGGI